MSSEDETERGIVHYLLKKCLEKPCISNEVKFKIMSSLNVTNDFGSTSSGEMFNPLGIEEDILRRPPDDLTPDQIDQLSNLFFEELRKFHYSCVGLKSVLLKLPKLKDEPEEMLSRLSNIFESELQKIQAINALESEAESLQSQVKDKLNNSQEELIKRAEKLLQNESMFLEELHFLNVAGKRGPALEEVEDILTRKFKKNAEEIMKLKLRIKEYEEMRCSKSKKN